jgi:hypothetical protein
VDGDGMPDAANAMDANVFEIITQTQTNMFPNSDLTTPSPKQVLSAEHEPESPTEDVPNPLEPSTPDAQP